MGRRRDELNLEKGRPKGEHLVRWEGATFTSWFMTGLLQFCTRGGLIFLGEGP